MIVNNWSVAKVLYVRYLGSVSGDELIEASLGVTGDHRWEGLHYLIGDWSQVESTGIDAKHLQQLIACLRPASTLCPRAVNAAIVKRNNTGTALAAWYNHVAEVLPWRIDIYHDPQEALTVYGLDPRLATG